MERWKRICYAIVIIGTGGLCGAYSIMAATTAEHSVKNGILAILWLFSAIGNFLFYNIALESDNDIFCK